MTSTNATRPRIRRLLAGASLVAVFAAGAAHAQAPAADGAQVEEVVVTGSSIRGAAPVGSSIIQVGQADIQKTGSQTIQQVLRSVPSVVGMNAVGQGGFGSADGAGTNAPTIHGLGASASNSTLILIDGHRFPLSGINHALADPNILAPLALERVEVLADGASSVYGSDAVAGVINFITRRNFNGVEVRAQGGYADGYHTWGAGAVMGKTWDTGSVLVAGGWSDRQGLLSSKRSFTARDRRAIGGSNLASVFCGPATIQVGSGNLINAPYTGAGVANAAANSMCDYSGLTDLIPSEERWSGMVKVTQEVTDKLKLSGDVVYSDRNNVNRDSRGTVQATIYGPGFAGTNTATTVTTTGQINPFFVGPAGTSPTSEIVRFDANQLFGPGAKTKSGEETAYFNGDAEYKLNDNWRATLGGTAGFSNSYSRSTGSLNSSAAILALNGTTNANGNQLTPSIPGTNVIALNTPLTTANALDVFGVGSANRTSAATLAKLIDNDSSSKARQTLQNVTFKVDGDLFSLPAGPLKAAFGAEYSKYTLAQDISRANNTGPASQGSTYLHLDYDRNVRSVYAEFLAPIVSPDMGVPFVRSFDINVSGRYDKYSDFGSTKNPRIGANWGVVDGLKLRANYARSFVAPALTSRGADANGTTAETNVSGGPTVTVPVSAYPNLIGLPGCPAGSVTCTLGGGAPGLQVNGGNASVGPQKGKTWSFGADWDVNFIPGLRLSATYWNNEIQGGVTAPSAALAVNAPGLASLLTVFGPAGATQAQINAITAGRPLATSIPNTVYYVYNFQQRNALNLWVQGVDLSANYHITTDMGRFGIDAVASYKTKFDQQVGAGGGKFSVLGTTGFNTTFPSIKLDTRVGVNWASNFGLAADLFWNRTGSYHNWSGSTVTPITRNAAGLPTGGGDKVKAGNFFDGHLAYDFQGEGLTQGLQVFADVNNIFDKKPPFYNSANGYDSFSGNPLGRQTTVGFKKKF